MAKLTVTELKELKDRIFKAQSVMLPVWQTIADHFYPERADFTQVRIPGQEFADHLIDSQPLLMRRDLGNSLMPMLRDGEWFEVNTQGIEPDYGGKAWLEWATRRLRKLIDSKQSGFVRATKQGDHDYISFGQTVLSIELNKQATGLLYRNWHLRDCAWMDDTDGTVGPVARKWIPTARDLVTTFGEDRVHPKVLEAVKGTGGKRNPFKEINCFHIVMPSDMYGDEDLQRRYPFVSAYVDETNNHEIEVTGLNYRYYIVPRFQTIAGSPYAYSTATVVGLPNARCLQAMTHTLLEAAERLARPPIVATEMAVRSDVDLGPDGITWVDKDYDEKLGAALRTLDMGSGRTWPIGDTARQDVVEVLKESFFLNTINLPGVDHNMTAYEVSERMKQFRRQNLPLFQPIEYEYNGQICETSFDLAMSAGLLGSPYDIPESLQGQDVEFKFQSPLTATEGEEKLNLFSQVSQILRQAAENDPGVRHNMNFDRAFRDAVQGVGAEIGWLYPEEIVQQKRMGDAMQEAAALASQAQS